MLRRYYCVLKFAVWCRNAGQNLMSNLCLITTQLEFITAHLGSDSLIF